MIINHNINAMNAHRNMGSTTIAQGKAMEKLNSGLRINRDTQMMQQVSQFLKR